MYVFTPKSKILALPRGPRRWTLPTRSTLDIGDYTVAAKVNGEQVALRTELRSGDVVEIITAPVSRPNPGVAQLRAHRACALSKIRHYLKNMKQEESVELGEKPWTQAMRAEGLRTCRRATRRRGRGGHAVAGAGALERQHAPAAS